jgi:hypothetical protein
MTDIATAASQSICVAALFGDLMLRTLLHDVRGSLMTMSGWIDLAAMDGKAVPPGLKRGVESLTKTLTMNDDNALLPTPGFISAAELIAGLPGFQVPAQNLRVQTCRDRFRTVLSLAAPDRIEVHAGKLSDRAVVTISGLAADGVCLAVDPVLSELTALRVDSLRERALGAALLRPLTWACGGSLRRSDTTTVEIILTREEKT